MNPDEIRRELKTQTSLDESPARKKKKRPALDRTRNSRPPAPAKSRQPQASERASMLGQRWYDHGEAAGFDFPYDANYFALALQRRIEKDPEIRPFLAKEKFEQVERWVTKMIDIWWNPVDSEDRGGYLTNEIHPRNAKEFFLDNDWEDLRDYARSSLRAAYLLEHGRRVPAPVYPGHQEYQDRLRELQRRHAADRLVKQVEEMGEVPDPQELDEGGRQRLRSFVEKRRKK